MTYLVHSLYAPPVEAAGCRDVQLNEAEPIHRAATMTDAEEWQFGEIKRQLMLRAGEVSEEFASEVSQWLNDGRPPLAVRTAIEDRVSEK